MERRSMLQSKGDSPWIRAMLFGFSFVFALVLVAIGEATGLTFFRFAAGGALILPFAVAHAWHKQRADALGKASGQQCARCDYDFKSGDSRFDFEGYCVCGECERFLSKGTGAQLPLFRSRDA